jgi:hypothetical protein
MPLSLEAIRDCLEGIVPAVMATCAADGTPNVAYLSQVQFVDNQHIALSFQFFNKTRQNVLANPHATLLVMHHQSAAFYRISVQYLHTDTSGALFESLKAKLAGIASHTGMGGVFRLQGADLYRVIGIEAVPGNQEPALAQARATPLPALRRAAERLNRCADLDSLLQAALGCLRDDFAIPHAMVLMLDRAGQRLYTVASHGYTASGVGSEIPLGQGVIGVAARENTPIRISHATNEYAYGRAMRDSAAQGGMSELLETGIPLPGLPRPGSQLAVPVSAFGEAQGVLYVESEQELRYTYDDEDALVGFAALLGAGMRLLQVETAEDGTQPAPATFEESGEPLPIRYYAADHSVFLGEDYLIKGVAGAIFWKLASEHVTSGRIAFSNRELRLDPALRLPEAADNLEARLLLLSRRLAERDTAVRIEKAGRGRFNLVTRRPLRLIAS